MQIIKGECKGYDGPNNLVHIHTERGNNINMPVLDYQMQEKILDNLFNFHGMYNWQIVEGAVVGYERA